MDELRTLKGSQLREMAAVPDKQVLALGAKIYLPDAQCIDNVIFSGFGQIKIGDHQSNGVTIGVALDEPNLMSAKCD
jgi:hypothetical protein